MELGQEAVERMAELKRVGCEIDGVGIDLGEGKIDDGAVAAVPLGDDAGRGEAEAWEVTDLRIRNHEPMARGHHVCKFGAEKRSGQLGTLVGSPGDSCVEGGQGPGRGGGEGGRTGAAKVAEERDSRMGQSRGIGEAGGAPVMAAKISEGHATAQKRRVGGDERT